MVVGVLTPPPEHRQLFQLTALGQIWPISADALDSMRQEDSEALPNATCHYSAYA